MEEMRENKVLSVKMRGIKSEDFAYGTLYLKAPAQEEEEVVIQGWISLFDNNSNWITVIEHPINIRHAIPVHNIQYISYRRDDRTEEDRDRVDIDLSAMSGLRIQFVRKDLLIECIFCEFLTSGSPRRVLEEGVAHIAEEHPTEKKEEE